MMSHKIGETKEDVFNDLLKKFEGTSRMREWNNAASGNEYDRNISNAEAEVKVFQKRFAAASA